MIKDLINIQKVKIAIYNFLINLFLLNIDLKK